MLTPAPATPRHVVFLAFERFQVLDLAGPMQVFLSASEHARDAATGLPVDYRVSVVSSGPNRVQGSLSLAIDTEPLPSALMPRTTVMVVGGRGVEAASRDSLLIDWLRSHLEEAERICSVCNGAILLARAGLLAGKRATTHWADCDNLQRNFRDVTVDRDAMYVRDGKIWSSAGISAGIDLALALVANDHGDEAAAVTARRMVVYVKRPGNQAQFSEFIETIDQDKGGAFAKLHQWILGNISRDLSVPVLAAQAGMSERTFARKYRRLIGVPPAETVKRLRADTARHHLRTSTLPLKTIAARSGFGSVEQMNRVHLKFYGLTSRTIRDIG
jgi:transcriptional regulator GlxA family with amidase domain